MYYLIRSNRVYGYPMTEPRPPKLLDQVRDVLRLKHYAFSTEKTYLQWIYRYIVFHNKRHPQDMGKVEIEAFLTHLAVQEQVTASTQNQAFSALPLSLYRQVLHQELDTIDALRARSSRYLPTVLTPPEVQTVFRQLFGVQGLVVPLLYGSGLRGCAQSLGCLNPGAGSGCNLITDSPTRFRNPQLDSEIPNSITDSPTRFRIPQLDSEIPNSIQKSPTRFRNRIPQLDSGFPKLDLKPSVDGTSQECLSTPNLLKIGLAKCGAIRYSLALR
jgi:hypothetical protein